MSRWEIKIAARPGDTALDVGANARHLESEEDRTVTRELATACATVGFKTAREMLLGLEELKAVERRALLDLMRRRAGLETASEIEAAEEAQVDAERHRPPEIIAANLLG